MRRHASNPSSVMLPTPHGKEKVGAEWMVLKIGEEDGVVRPSEMGVDWSDRVN